MAAVAAACRSSTTFDAALWLKQFSAAKGRDFRDLRFDIQLGTLEACKNFKYSNPDGETVSLGNHESVSREARKTRLYNDIAPHPSTAKEAASTASAAGTKSNVDDTKKETKGDSVSSSDRESTSADVSASLAAAAATADVSASASGGADSASASALAGLSLGDTAPFRTSVRVVEGDCLEEGLRLKSSGLNPVVLNMASAKRPGGGYMTGSGAQEENLFRRTNYVQHLADPDREFDPERKWSYRLPEFACVYSRNVLVFRAAEDKGYAFLKEAIPMSFVALSAYVNPRVDKNGQLQASHVERSKRKIRCMFMATLAEGHDAMVLSAWGCGAFGNPPSHIAQLFREVMEEDGIRGRFKHISFAVIDDHNAIRKGSTEGNFRPFQRVFQDWPSA